MIYLRKKYLCLEFHYLKINIKIYRLYIKIKIINNIIKMKYNQILKINLLFYFYISLTLIEITISTGKLRNLNIRNIIRFNKLKRHNKFMPIINTNEENEQTSYNNEKLLLIKPEDLCSEPSIPDTKQIEVKDYSDEFQKQIGDHEYETTFKNSAANIKKTLSREFQHPVEEIMKKYFDAVGDKLNCLKKDDEVLIFARLQAFFSKGFQIYKSIQETSKTLKKQNFLPTIQMIYYDYRDKIIELSIMMDLIDGPNLFEVFKMSNIHSFEKEINDGKINEDKVKQIKEYNKKLNENYPFDYLFGILLKAYSQLHLVYEIHSYDIKPENVVLYINKDNKIDVKLIDFDSGFKIDSPEENKIEELHTTLGRHYIPFPSGTNVNKNSKYDEFQIGLVLISVIAKKNLLFKDCITHHKIHLVNLGKSNQEINKTKCNCNYLIDSVISAVTESKGKKLSKNKIKKLGSIKDILLKLLNTDDNERIDLNKAYEVYFGQKYIKS